MKELFSHIIEHSFDLFFNSRALQDFSSSPIYFIGFLEPLFFLDKSLERDFKFFCEFLVAHLDERYDVFESKGFFGPDKELASGSDFRELVLKKFKSSGVDGELKPILDEDKFGLKTANGAALIIKSYLSNTSGYCLIMSLPISFVNLKYLNNLRLMGMISNG